MDLPAGSQSGPSQKRMVPEAPATQDNTADGNSNVDLSMALRKMQVYCNNEIKLCDGCVI